MVGESLERKIDNKKKKKERGKDIERERKREI